MFFFNLRDVLEWKIKYKKYKPLTQAKTCTKCHQRNIKKAYHVLCRSCALENKVCAKCLTSSEKVEIIPPEPTEQEQLKLKVEMDRLIKSLPERKRRAFLRYMEKGKQIETEDKEEGSGAEDDDVSDDEEGIEKEPRKTVPHSRDDLLKKFEELKMSVRKDDDEDSDFDDFSDSDFEDF